jgi:mannose-1-phosphate guanylyltransferase
MTSDTGGIERFWAVIPAGGAGTRLWPLSRRSVPKFLHDLTGSGRTLLQGTWDRLGPLAPDRIVVVTGVAHAEAVAGQLPGLGAHNLIAEPSPRDSMPAIGLAAAVIARRDPEAVIGSFAADHVIGEVDAFHDAVREAVAVARTGLLVTIGITPTEPATGFGYIREGEPLGIDGAPSARAVRAFVEKPSVETARGYLRSGEYRWNAGMFVVQARVLLDLLRQWHPDLADGVEAIAADPDLLAGRWGELIKIAIDHAVAEPAADAGRVAVVPAQFSWDDVGGFDSLGALLEVAADAAGGPMAGMRVLGPEADVLAVDSTALVVAGSGRLVAVVGVDDLVVVDTPDAVLVVPRARAQEVKSLVDRLSEHGRADLL